jgi:glycosyltransferase involved in cell wall biosynthesis
LIGMARRLKADLGAPVACALQGEDSFLDGLPEPHRTACWRTLAERAAEVDLFIAPSRYYGNLMRGRLGLRPERVRVVHNGINLAGYEREVQSAGSPPSGGPNIHQPISSIRHPELRLTHHESRPPSPLVLGFFARMCPEKGLDTLVEAYLVLRQRGRVGNLKLRLGGSCGPADEAFVNSLRERLQASGLLADVEFYPNVDRAAKVGFLRSLSVFSVPARYGEAFGLYVIEAMAAGVPVVQPRVAAFPELIEATGGGVLCAADDPRALAVGIEELLLDHAGGQALGEAGRRAVFERFSAEAMSRAMAQAYAEVTGKQAGVVA